MLYDDMFDNLKEITRKPAPYERYTAADMWNDPYVSKKMLAAHLDPSSEPASRNEAFINRSAKWITKRFDINNTTKLADFGCGPGLYTTKFAEAGANVTGIDFSESSIGYAKKTAAEKKLNINYVNDNYLNFETKDKFDLITMIYCDFCALSDEQRKTLLNKFHHLLKDNGSLFLDVYSINHFNATPEKSLFDQSSDANFWTNFWSKDPYYVFTNTFKYEDKKLTLDKYDIFEEKRTWEILNWIKSYNLQAITEELKQNGFKVVEHYSNVAGDEYNDTANEIAIIGQKG